MALVPIASLVSVARARGCGVGAFNVITLEHAEAIVAGAESIARPVVLQISENCVRFHGALRPLASAALAVARASTVDVAVHLDHVRDTSLLVAAAEVGLGSVMIDGSGLPFEDNVATTRAAVEWAHARGLWVEAELGEVGGKDGAHAPWVRTDPDQARLFVTTTGVDALAVAVGSSHAMTTRTASLDHALITLLARTVPVPLVLHGSSGVPDHDLRHAVRAGLVKINIGTALNVAYTRAVRSALAADPEMVDPRRYLTAAREAMATTVAHLLTVITC